MRSSVGRYISISIHECDGWRRCHNEEVRQLFLKPYVLKVIKISRCDRQDMFLGCEPIQRHVMFKLPVGTLSIEDQISR